MQTTEKPIRAAQYVRMSTDQQVYSTGNQIDAIAVYAAMHDFEIVRTYADEGRSGLNLKGRSALQQLLADVLSEEAGFEVILVYDVSRWGRFQDADESAHYEFLCRKAGVPVHYCAEEFRNDGSVSATIMKSLKRVMAGEYSRELSAKVFAGCVRLAKQGFKMGGAAPFGYRRMMVDDAGRPKGILLPGQQKHLRTDHVVLVPGPADEIALVRRIFALCVRKKLSTTLIARTLNMEGHCRPSGQPWTAEAVAKILRSEQYAGVGIYGRDSKKLGGRQVRNDPSLWVKHEGFIEPLVDHATYRAARRGMTQRQWRQSDDQLLDKLRDLYERKGWLSVQLLLREPGMPMPGTYGRRFGSFTQACRMVGYVRPSLPYVSVHASVLERALALIDSLPKLIASSGGRAQLSPSDHLVIVDRTILLGATLCRERQQPTGGYWRVHLHPGYDIDFMLVGLLKGVNDDLWGYTLLPTSRFSPSGSVQMSERCPKRPFDRFQDLSDLLALIREYDRRPRHQR